MRLFQPKTLIIANLQRMQFMSSGGPNPTTVERGGHWGVLEDLGGWCDGEDGDKKGGDVRVQRGPACFWLVVNRWATVQPPPRGNHRRPPAKEEDFSQDLSGRQRGEGISAPNPADQ